MRRLVFIFIISLLWGIVPTFAHANLLRANPSPNTSVETAPYEIRLWFTEALEPNFSRIQLRDSEGNTLDFPSAVLDIDDATQLFVPIDDLPTGVYTVAWRVVSQTDGHTTQGNFAIGIGETLDTAVAETVDESIPPDSAIIRWLNFISLAIGVGSVGFWVFVWHPAFSEEHPNLERRLRIGINVGWLSIGLTTILLLFLQVSIIDNVGFFEAFSSPNLLSIISDSRAGQLWILRVMLWAMLGVWLYVAERNPRFYTIALLTGMGIILTTSLFSHASSAVDSTVSILADSVHLLGMALWVGGLLQLLNVIPVIRKNVDTSAISLGQLVAYFSNLARVSVIILIVTGLYATWLQVGSVRALFETAYGQALLLKLVLVLPLLGIAGINLVLTHRGLRAGKAIWETRLRKLVGLEIVLTIMILALVGMMTAFAPARNTIALKDALPKSIEPTPFAEMQNEDDLDIELTFSPGWVGRNTFSVQLNEEDGTPIENATRVLVRFEHQTENLGESALTLEHQEDGQYIGESTNLSVPGDWRLRVQIQRPDEFDTLVDFNPTVNTVPAPPPAPLNNPLPDFESRQVAMLVMSIGSLIGGAILIVTFRDRRLQSVSGLLSILGIIFLVRGVSLSPPSPIFETPTFADDAPVQMAIDGTRDLPILITQGGMILQPDGETWNPLPLDAVVRDVATEDDLIWAATDKGLFVHNGDEWTAFDEHPAEAITMTHGYIYSMGKGDITRITQGTSAFEVEPLFLDTPNNDLPAENLVMLGNHSHVLLDGEQVYHSPDLGLSWQNLDAPEAVRAITEDEDGDLLAVTDTSILRWNWGSGTWDARIALPNNLPVDDFIVHDERLYALAGGQLYRRANRDWQQIVIDGLPDDAYLTSMVRRFPDTLRVLDAQNQQLWGMVDDEWSGVEVKVTSDE